MRDAYFFILKSQFKSMNSGKIALCFIVSYPSGNLEKENIWIQWINKNPELFNIYVHYKTFDNLSDFLKSHIIPPSHIVSTNYFHVVGAYMSILSWAYHHDPLNKWFCLLTESCVPVVSSDSFLSQFQHKGHQSLLKWGSAFWNINYHKRANLHRLDNCLHLWNDPWFILTRDHVYCCIQFATTRHDMYKLICNGGLANESIFAIILYIHNKLTPENTINESSTLVDWSRKHSPTSPYVFTNNDNTNDTNNSCYSYKIRMALVLYYKIYELNKI